MRSLLNEREIKNEMVKYNLTRLTAIRRIQSRKAILASSAPDGAPLHYVPYSERRS